MHTDLQQLSELDWNKYVPPNFYQNFYQISIKIKNVVFLYISSYTVWKKTYNLSECVSLYHSTEYGEISGTIYTWL